MLGATELVREAAELPIFDRKFWDGEFRFTRIGGGSLGGKASGLAAVKDLLPASIVSGARAVVIGVPTMAVIATDAFDLFLARNGLGGLPFQEMPDERIAHAFQHAPLPSELVGDLRALIEQVHTPLAVRSSSLLEDALRHPFAGVYATKMIPNNEPDPDSRSRRLLEAIKLVYASTFFAAARDYIAGTGHDPRQEKMAVILQEVVGRRHGDRFYPDVSGVARSYNFYASAPARPADGVATLALGLGKTIVDGGRAWSFSPAYPKKPPPFTSIQELLHGTQQTFWAVNMGKAPAYDPVNEVECLVEAGLDDADRDDVIRYVASSYDPDSETLMPGRRFGGTHVVNFAPLLQNGPLHLSEVIRSLLRAAEAATGAKVEIEFAITFEEHPPQEMRARLGFLQVRPMSLPEEQIEVGSAELMDERAIIESEHVIGNGESDTVEDIVLVRPDNFRAGATPRIAQQLAQLNRGLLAQGRKYLLIGFGRWGSSHPWLGIPVAWGQISGARAIVESTLPQMETDLSQGSHFFHNLSSFGVYYFMVRHDQPRGVDWAWLDCQPVESETEFVRHLRLPRPLRIRVDGRSGRGVILRQEGS